MAQRATGDVHRDCDALSYARCDIESIERHLSRTARHTTAQFGRLWLSSTFQPVISLVHQRPIGYEGLLRARADDGVPVSPAELFTQATTEADIIHLDRLCRALHLSNFQNAPPSADCLFLNVSPQAIVNGRRYGSFFAEVLERSGVPAERIVIEVLENSIDDEAALASAVDYYRGLGCLVAIDDFGSGSSNLDRVLSIRPDIVKIDRSFMARTGESARGSRRILTSLVSLIHDAGCLALIEGIKTEQHADIAADTDADFVQGFYFAHPTAFWPDTSTWVGSPAKKLSPGREVTARLDTRLREQEIRRYRQAFQRCISRIATGTSIEEASDQLLRKPRSVRCYMLDDRGYQIGANVEASPASTTTGRTLGVASTTGACWERRPYFRRAVREPGQVQITRPYLSLAGAHMCVTLSVAVESADDTRVVCCDLLWD